MTHLRLILLLLASLMSGCAGRVFLVKNTTAPYTSNFNKSPVGTKSCRIVDRQLRGPIKSQSVSVLWNEHEIREQIKAAGITNVHYIDRETFSVLNAIYRRRTLVVYGD
jgi:hypothetical protein